MVFKKYAKKKMAPKNHQQTGRLKGAGAAQGRERAGAALTPPLPI
jgi:hypothetical protein